ADALSAPSVDETLRTSHDRPVWTRALPWTIAAVALGVAAFVLWASTGDRRSDSAQVRRLELTLPAGVEMFTSSQTVAVSPDGTRVAFVGVRAGTRLVYLRALDQFEAVPLQGSESASGCFFSPDGQSIGVLNNQGLMRTISLSNRLVTTVTDDVNFLYGAAWGPDDRIVFVRNGSLWRIPRSGGNATQLTKLENGDTLHWQPRFMP